MGILTLWGMRLFLLQFLECPLVELSCVKIPHNNVQTWLYSLQMKLFWWGHVGQFVRFWDHNQPLWCGHMHREIQMITYWSQQESDWVNTPVTRWQLTLIKVWHSSEPLQSRTETHEQSLELDSRMYVGSLCHWVSLSDGYILLAFKSTKRSVKAVKYKDHLKVLWTL